MLTKMYLIKDRTETKLKYSQQKSHNKNNRKTSVKKPITRITAEQKSNRKHKRNPITIVARI